MYVVLKLLLWGTITCSLLWTIVVMLGHSNGGSYVALCMHIVSIIILVVLCPLGVSHAGKNEKRFIKLLQLFQFAVFAFVFVAVFETVGSATMSFYIGSPGSGVISGYEAIFIWALFHVGAGFLLVLISQGERRTEMNAVVGGVLIIMGILMPKVFESYSLLQAYCYSGRCLPEESSWSILFEMAIAYAASLSMMFVVGLFSSSIMSFICSCAQFVSSPSKVSSLASSQNAEVTVSEPEIATVSDKQNDGVELAPGSSSTATCVPQEAADGVAISVQATDAAASARGSGGAVSKQLMSAAVSGLVAGACFSVVNRLLSRH